jgi:hypothetical protein
MFVRERRGGPTGTFETLRATAELLASGSRLFGGRRAGENGCDPALDARLARRGSFEFDPPRDQLDRLQLGRSLEIAAYLAPEPKVRIHSAPAESRANFRPGRLFDNGLCSSRRVLHPATVVPKDHASRVAKAVLIGAVPPLMLKTEPNPGGLPLTVFDDIRQCPRRSRSVLERPQRAFLWL